MAKATLPFPTEFKLPGLKLPKVDLDALFATQKANLAAVQEAQTVLLGAVEAIAKVQHGYVEQAVAELKAAVDSKELPKAEAFTAAGEKAKDTTKEVVDLAVAGENLIVPRCQSGLASAIAVKIDSAKIKEIVGTIAGDDTIMIAVENGPMQRLAIKKLWDVLSK